MNPENIEHWRNEILQLRVENAGQLLEIERLTEVVRANRRLLLKWRELYKDLDEATEFLTK